MSTTTETTTGPSFSILDKRSISFNMGTAMTKGGVVDMLVHVDVGVNGIFYPIA
jgi:alcohol dehydrogenase YqhD (iron-dependent ADH family)